VNNLSLSPRLQKLVDLGESGTDIMHGELKNLMYEAERELENVSELQDQPTHRYLTGLLDAYATVYQLTYELSFAISDRHKLTNPA
jgi:hypothetical protein